MKRYLDQLRFEVLELDSCEGVANLISTHEIEAIILDILMDRHGGIKTIVELTQLPTRPKIIVVSSNLLYLDFAKLFGAEAVLIKPISQDILSSVLYKQAISA